MQSMLSFRLIGADSVLSRNRDAFTFVSHFNLGKYSTTSCSKYNETVSLTVQGLVLRSLPSPTVASANPNNMGHYRAQNQGRIEFKIQALLKTPS